MPFFLHVVPVDVSDLSGSRKRLWFDNMAGTMFGKGASMLRGRRKIALREEPETALVFGGTSDIGRAVARKLAGNGFTLQLAARDAGRLKREACDIRLRTGMSVTEHCCDVLLDSACLSLIDELDPLPDIAVCVVGLLGDQAECQRDSAAAERVMRTNYIGPALLMNVLAERFERRGSGVLVGISSVAGDRGRAANYVYGSAKAGFAAFLSGLRNRLATSGVHVVTVKPGFVRTRMTDGMDLPAGLTAGPDEVAAVVVKAIRQRLDVVYVRRVWRVIGLVLCAIPERFFKRMKV